MKIIVGLGNPGEKYEKTRHNAGFMAMDSLILSQARNFKFKVNKKFEAEVCELDDVLLVKPMTFMNESGRSVRKIVDFYKLGLDGLWVVHDDLDIPLGKYKIQKGKGPKGHRGVLSVEDCVGGDFWRVRLGIDSRNFKLQILNDKLDLNLKNQMTKISGEKYTLMNFTRKERRILDEVIGKIVSELCI